MPASNSFLAAIVNSSSDAILSKDLDGVITSWNPGAERLFGYMADEVIGKPVTILFPPDRIDEEPEILQRIQRGEMIDHYETVRVRKDGTRIAISLTVSPIVDAAGTIIGASKIARDITEFKRAQSRLQATLAGIGDAVIATDCSGRVTFMNGKAEDFTGWTEAEAKEQPVGMVLDVIEQGSRSPVADPVTLVLERGGAVEPRDHLLLINRSGNERPVEESAAPIRAADGLLEGVVLVLRDVAERRAADFEATRLAAIVEGSDDAIVGKDLQSIVTSWNSGAERLFGFTAEEMIGQSITRLLPPDRQGEEQQILTRLQRGERVQHFETSRVRKDGSLVDVSLTISPIRDHGGRVVGASKIARDITLVRQAREQLKAYAEDLEQKVRERTAKLHDAMAELEAFSYSLSHDMRAPIRAIHSFTEIVLEDYGEKMPGAAEYLRKVINAAGRMDRLIQDVLAFARVSQTEIRLKPVDADKLVEEIIQERPELQDPQAEVSIVGELPPVWGHEASLTQCLTNLLHNAVKFVAPGVNPKVEVFGRTTGEGRVQICVRDNGIGIEPEGRDRLFAIFQRMPTEHHYQGTGIGLAIVRKAAERMNGSVGVESAPNEGSTFWIELPAAS